MLSSIIINPKLFLHLNLCCRYDTKTYGWSALKISDTSEFSANPGKRYGHSAVVVEMHPLKIMFYGGLVSAASFNFDDEDNMLEQDIEQEKVASAEYDDEDSDNVTQPVGQKRVTQMWRKKGKKNDDTEEFDEHVYFLTLNKTAWEWTKPVVKTQISNKERPSARTEHSVAKVSTNVVAIFGGWTSDGRPQNDLWMLDYQNLEWTRKDTSGIQPRPRYRHTCEVIGNRLWILGGSDNGDDDASRASKNVMAGISELNLDTLVWTHPVIQGANPFPRSSHTSVVVGTNSIAIFGGRYSGQVYYNDIFLINKAYQCTLI